MRRVSIEICALALACGMLLTASAADDPRQGQKTAAGAPETPFLLPTYSGEPASLQAPLKPEPAGPEPDGRELYERALACWPVRSLFRGELTLEGRLRNDRSLGSEAQWNRKPA